MDRSLPIPDEPPRAVLPYSRGEQWSSLIIESILAIEDEIMDAPGFEKRKRAIRRILDSAVASGMHLPIWIPYNFVESILLRVINWVARPLKKLRLRLLNQSSTPL